MNKIYKVIWSKVRNCYVAVSEIAKRNGKSCTSVNCGGSANRGHAGVALSAAVGATLLAGVCSVLLPVRVALAAPVMPTLDYRGATADVTIASTSNNTTATMNITSTKQNNVLKWIDFSIGKGGTVQFDPNNYLNYVTGHGRSEIDGILKQTKNSGGQRGSIYIVNPNGVLFGDNARVDVGSLYVSTRDISDKLSDFDTAVGALFPATYDSAAVGDVINLGKLNADVIQVEGKNISFKNIADVTKGGTLTNGDITGGTAHHEATDGNVTLTVNNGTDNKGEIHLGFAVSDTPAEEINDTQYTNVTPPTLTGWNANVAPTKYMLVRNAFELQNMKNNVTKENGDYNPGNYMLANDINFKNADDEWVIEHFQPIGSYGSASTPMDGVFQGRFDGLNYAINNIKIDSNDNAKNASAKFSNIGIFGSNAGTIENLRVVDATVDASNIASNGYLSQAVGGIVGANKANGIIRNVSFSGTVKGGYYVGGIAGYQNGAYDRVDGKYPAGKIEKAYNTGTIEAVYKSGYTNSADSGSRAGGIVGENYGVVSEVYNSGKVSGDGTGNGNNKNVGGIAGSSGYTSSISNAYNTGEVSGKKQVGGIAGVLEATTSSGGTINNTYNSGSITIINDSSYYGGIVGYKYDGATVSNSYFSNGNDNGYGTQISDASKLKEFDTFAGSNLEADNRWDMSKTGGAGTVWRIYEGQTTPLLTAFLKTKDVVTETEYNGSAQQFDENLVTGDSHITATNVGDYVTETNAGKYDGLDEDKVLYSDQLGYDIVDTKLIIQPKRLNLVNASKVYDGTTDVNAAVLELNASDIGSDYVDLADNKVTGVYADKNVGTGKAVTYTIDDGALTGTDAGNYIISAAGTGDITAKELTVSFADISKTYDGNTSATAGTGTLLGGIISGDEVTLNTAGIVAEYTDKNAGAGNKAVNYSGIALTGTDAGNYSIAETAQNTTSTITPKTLSLANVSKEYDGTANVEAGDIALATGIIDGDDAEFNSSNVTGLYEDENVNVSGSKAVTYTINTGALTGADAGNYIIATAGTGDITPRTVTLDGTISKVYDRTNTATPTVDALSNVIEADKEALSISATSAAYSDVNVGNNLTVTYEGLQLGGTKAGNYSLKATGATVLKNSITQRPVTLTGTISKVYDGTTAAIPSAHTLENVIGEDLEDLDLLATSASFDNKNVGENNRTITYDGLVLSGEKAPNYSLTSTSATIDGNTIIPKELALVADKVRIKKGGTPPTTFTGNLTGFVPGEELNQADRSKLSFTASVLDTTTAGSYAITGTFNGQESGTYRINDSEPYNYTFKNAESNKTAFTIFTDMMPKLDFKGASAYVTIDDTTANTMVISSTQDNNVLKWIDFSIDSGGTVKYDAKNYLNFVTGHGRSEIYGTLTGDGNIYLINPNGILFGSDAQVDVGNLYLSTRNLTETQLADYTTGVAALYKNDNAAVGDVINMGRLDADLIKAEGRNISFKNIADVTKGGTLTDGVITGGTAHNEAANGSVTLTVNNVEADPDHNLKENKGEIHLGFAVSDTPADRVNTTQYSNVTVPTLSGWAANVTPTMYMLVRNEYELQNMNNNLTKVNAGYMPGNYMLANDIDASLFKFMPVGSVNGGGPEDPGVFKGKFDGLYHVIKDITIDKTSVRSSTYTDIGIIGSNAGTVENLGVVNGTVDATGISNNSAIGGIVGANKTGAVIRNVYFSGSVKGLRAVGGIAGWQNSAYNSYPHGIIENAYSTGTVSGSTANANTNSINPIVGQIGGIIREAYGRTSDDRYDIYDSNSTRTLNVTASAMKNVQTFTAKGWTDVSTDGTGSATWRIYEGKTMPLLTAFLRTKALVTETEYNGSEQSFDASITTGDDHIIAVDTSDFTAKGTNAGVYGETKKFYSDQQGYNIVDTELVIQPKRLTIGNISKVYDGSTTATVTKDKLIGLLEGDATGLTISNTTANFDNKNAGEGKSIEYSGLSLSGGKSGNYMVAASGTSLTGNIITQAPITLSVADGYSRAYNGGVDASGATTTITSGEVFTGDSILSITKTFDDKNVKTGKTITVSNAVIGDGAGNNSNYNISYVTNTASTITQKTITATFADISKTYDGTTSATTGVGTLSGVETIDAGKVSVSASAAYDQRNAGSRIVNYSGVALSGDEAANYSIATTATGAGTITPKELTATFADISKTYDGTTSATAGAGTLAGVIAADEGKVSVSASAAYDQKNAGSRIVNYSGVALSGDEAANYSIATTATGAGTITPKALTATFADITKVYDGTTSATAGAGTLSGVETVDTGKVSVSASAAYDEKNAGRRTVNYTGVTLSGSEAANYSIATTATGAGTITPKELTATFADISKIYDGTTNTAPGAGTLTGVIAADEGKVSVSASAAYDEKNAGSRTVNYTGVTLSGAEAGNYSIATTATGNGTIGRKALELVADPASTQEGDYNPATFTGRVTGFVAGDGIENGDTLLFSLSNPSAAAVGSYAVVGTINGKASGNYGLNYTFTNAASNANAFVITARPASVQDMVLSDIIPGIKGKSGADISVTALDNAMEQARDKRAEVGIEFAVAQTILSVDADRNLSLENRGMKQPPAMTPQEVAEQVHAQQGKGNGVAAQAGGNAGAASGGTNENGAASNAGVTGAVNAAMDVVQQTDDAVGTEESKRKKGVA